ncbi:hypothetical protein C942_02497 [Photobacterium marinum]|uniref:DUF2971 domain-containing protein n=2 Tax=Photobacterium marinum TaxID=1056511 RepID=L8J8F4_9GAMM|nr:hypothetical protein C942_02497 [Photobacterium marinum]
MSIDKFIDLLDNQRLFLTPLSYYQSTDPFEGHVPKVAFEAMMNIVLDRINVQEKEILELEKAFHERVGAGIHEASESDLDSIERAKNNIKSQREDLIPSFNKIVKSTGVNCWYNSESESEAMWKLYSDSGKGIAIKTSVASLVEAICSCEQTLPLRLGKIKYLDFLSDTLKPQDCITDGDISPLLKRNEFQHENEVRLYSVPQIHASDWESYELQPMMVDIDITKLIEKVYISPYVGEPFTSSVNTVCRLFNIPKSIVCKSELLKDYEKMLSGFVSVET